MEQKEIVRNNYKYLLETLEVEVILTNCFQYEVFTRDEYDKVDSVSQVYEKRKELLRILDKKGRSDYMTFFKILRSEQPTVATRLEFLKDGLSDGTDTEDHETLKRRHRGQRNLPVYDEERELTKSPRYLQLPNIKLDNSHHGKLRRHHVELKKNLEVTEILDELYEREIFSHTQMMKCKAKETRSDQCEELLSILLRKDKQAYDGFLLILDKHQPHIKHLLENAEEKREWTRANDELQHGSALRLKGESKLVHSKSPSLRSSIDLVKHLKTDGMEIKCYSNIGLVREAKPNKSRMLPSKSPNLESSLVLAKHPKTYEMEIDQLKREKVELEKKVETLQKEKKDLEKIILLQEQENERLHKEIKQLGADNETKDRTVEELREIVHQHEEQINVLKKSLNSIQETLRERPKLKRETSPATRAKSIPNKEVFPKMHSLPGRDIQSLRCPRLIFDSLRVNVTHASVNEIYQLENKALSGSQKKHNHRLTIYQGTTTTAPLSQGGCPRYWEIKAKIRILQRMRGRCLLLELGLCPEEAMDHNISITDQTQSYSLQITHCHVHNSVCREVSADKYPLEHLPNTLPNIPEQESSLHFGILLDDARGKVAFIDISHQKVIAVINLDNPARQRQFWPMFGVYNPNCAAVSLSLVVGNIIEMTQVKKIMILECLEPDSLYSSPNFYS